MRLSEKEWPHFRLVVSVADKVMKLRDEVSGCYDSSAGLGAGWGAAPDLSL